MFSEPQGQLKNSKLCFYEKIDDTFGDSIVRDIYEPLERNLQNLVFAWNEAEVKKMEIISLLIELRTII